MVGWFQLHFRDRTGDGFSQVKLDVQVLLESFAHRRSALISASDDKQTTAKDKAMQTRRRAESGPYFQGESPDSQTKGVIFQRCGFLTQSVHSALPRPGQVAVGTDGHRVALHGLFIILLILLFARKQRGLFLLFLIIGFKVFEFTLVNTILFTQVLGSLLKRKFQVVASEIIVLFPPEGLSKRDSGFYNGSIMPGFVLYFIAGLS